MNITQRSGCVRRSNARASLDVQSNTTSRVEQPLYFRVRHEFPAGRDIFIRSHDISPIRHAFPARCPASPGPPRPPAPPFGRKVNHPERICRGTWSGVPSCFVSSRSRVEPFCASQASDNDLRPTSLTSCISVRIAKRSLREHQSLFLGSEIGISRTYVQRRF